MRLLFTIYATVLGLPVKSDETYDISLTAANPDFELMSPGYPKSISASSSHLYRITTDDRRIRIDFASFNFPMSVACGDIWLTFSEQNSLQPSEPQIRICGSNNPHYIISRGKVMYMYIFSGQNPKMLSRNFKLQLARSTDDSNLKQFGEDNIVNLKEGGLVNYEAPGIAPVQSGYAGSTELSPNIMGPSSNGYPPEGQNPYPPQSGVYPNYNPMSAAYPPMPPNHGDMTGNGPMLPNLYDILTMTEHKNPNLYNPWLDIQPKAAREEFESLPPRQSEQKILKLRTAWIAATVALLASIVVVIFVTKRTLKAKKEAAEAKAEKERISKTKKNRR